MPRRDVCPWVLLSVAVALTSAATSACGGSTGQQGPRVAPPYGGHDAELFDDTIEPRAVGYDLERGFVPTGDPALRERAQIGDAVVRARVTTVTSKNEDRGLTWQIGFHTLARVAGTGALPDEFTVELGPRSPSGGILRAWEGRLIGMKFLVFAREFARPGAPGESDLHFHLGRDAKEDAAAVLAAVADPIRDRMH